MAHHVAETGQGAFTWTGPYGSGKSSLVVALSALLNGDAGMRAEAVSIIGKETAAIVWNAMPPGTDGWQVLPIVGRRDRPEQLIGEAIESRKLLGHKQTQGVDRAAGPGCLVGNRIA